MSPWLSAFRQSAVLFVLLAVGLAVVLFTVKHQVQALEEELGGLNREIAQNENTVRVLRAEFDVLTDAERLKRLSARHLNLAPIEPEQLATFSRLRQLLDGGAGDADGYVGGGAPGVVVTPARSGGLR